MKTISTSTLRAARSKSIRLQIVSPTKAPPDSRGWLHEIRHDGHRLIAIVPRIWHGEISLYRAAYGLGGLGLAVASLLGDGLQEAAAAVGQAGGWVLWSLVSAGEISIAWLATVASWRSSQRGPPAGDRYGSLAIGLALAFVGAQFILTIGWTGWTGLAGLGLAPSPGLLFLDRLIQFTSWISG